MLVLDRIMPGICCFCFMQEIVKYGRIGGDLGDFESRFAKGQASQRYKRAPQRYDVRNTRAATLHYSATSLNRRSISAAALLVKRRDARSGVWKFCTGAAALLVKRRGANVYKKNNFWA